jgi:hypothetical protein
MHFPYILRSYLWQFNLHLTRKYMAFASLLLLASTTHCFAFERYNCTETWYKQSLSHTDAKKSYATKYCSPDKSIKGPTDAQEVRVRTTVVKGQAFWVSTQYERHKPCAGRGVGTLGQVLDPVCYLPNFLQINENIENRNYYWLSDDGAHFKPSKTKQTTLTQWQTNQLNRFTQDSKTVFYNSEPVINADPETFEVIFPFGNDKKFENYAVTKDKAQTYIEGISIPSIDLNHITWLPITCKDSEDECKSSAYSVGLIGKSNHDVLYLKYADTPTVFKNWANDNIECWRKGYGIFCKIDESVYQITSDFDIPSTYKKIN